jgi:CHAT domain-containing protein
LTRIEAEIARLEQEMDLLEAELRQADPRYAELRYPRPSTLAEVQDQVLEAGELLLEYALGDSASYLFAVTKTSFRFCRLPARPTLEAQVHQLLPMLRDYNILGDDPTYFVAAACTLGRNVLAPVLAELTRADEVIIAPGGILHYLPFEALLIDAHASPESATPSRSKFADLPYLALVADVAYVPSVSALARLRAGASTAGTTPTADLLLVGDPEPPPTGEQSIFAQAVGSGATVALPHGAEEIAGLRSLYPGPRSVVLSKAKATLAEIKRGSERGPYRFVHFAAHGIFNEQRPQYSGLLLSSDDTTGDDGFLTTTEVFGLDLECEQVVLSSCASALGEHVSGEGLVGLTRGFMYAGAQSVLAALWDVAGWSTAAFMADFYTDLARTPDHDRVHALAEAKRRMIKGNSDTAGAQGEITLAHPYFWAAFVLMGDSR